MRAAQRNLALVVTDPINADRSPSTLIPPLVWGLGLDRSWGHVGRWFLMYRFEKKSPSIGLAQPDRLIRTRAWWISQ